MCLLNFQRTSFQTSHLHHLSSPPGLVAALVQCALHWVCLRDQTVQQCGQSFLTCAFLLGTPLQLVLDRGSLDCCSDSVFKEAASSLLSMVDWPQGDLSLPQVPAPSRPPLLTVKHERWPRQACRHTSEQPPFCSSHELPFLFQGAQKPFPWLLLLPLQH